MHTKALGLMAYGADTMLSYRLCQIIALLIITNSISGACECPNTVFDLSPGESGVIVSPTCPNLNCSYYFSTTAGYVLQYEFNDFYIQDCTDKLSILDTSRNDTWELMHFCGQIKPDQFFTTSTRQSAIQFVAGHKNVNATFNITYKAVEYVEDCGCTFGQPMVISSHPNGIYVTHKFGCRFVDCVYELKLPSAAVQQIRLNLTVSAPGPHNMFYIYQGLPSGNMQLYDTYERADYVNVTLQGDVTIHYHSGRKTQIHPLLASFMVGFTSFIDWPECECGTSELDAQNYYQHLLSPKYCPEVVCIWTITAPEGKDVLVKIQEINLESGVDYLRIYCGTIIADIYPVQMLTGNHTSKRIYICRTALTLHLCSGDGSAMASPRFNIKYKVLSENDNIGRIMVAENFETLVDNKMDPCDDFYEYACGNFQGLYHGEHLYEELQPKLAQDLANSFEQLSVNNSSLNALQQLKKAFTICKTDETPDDQITMEHILWLNKTTGGLPLIYQNQIQHWNPYKLAGIFAAHGHELLIRAGVMDIWDKQEGKMISFDQGVPLIPLASRIGNLTTVDEQRSKIYNQSIKVASVVGMRESLNETMLMSDISAILLIDQILAHGGDKGSHHRETYAQQYNLYSIEEAKSYWPNIGWESFLSGFMGDEMRANYSDRLICIRNPRYFDTLSQLERNFQDNGMLARHLQNYLLWQMLDKFSEDALPDYDKERKCALQLNKMLRIGPSRAYIDYMWSSNSNTTTKIKEMEDYIMKSFHRIISQATWMTEDSKQRAHVKVDKIKSIIGYPDWMMDDEMLDEMHPVEQLNILDGDSKLDSFVKIWDWQTWLVGHLLEQNRWPSYTPTKIGAWHDPQDNSIFISAATIAAHTFNTEFPSAANFGALGFFMAHEVGHALNIMEFNERGLLDQWADTKTMAQFQKLKDCFIEQYSNSCYPNYDNICINGQLTLDENLADHVALVASYDAYKSYINDHGEEQRLPGEWSNLSMEQVYFVAMAHNWCEEDGDPKETILTHEHAPNKWRVINTLRNSPTFAKEFKCETSAGMAPEHYCSAWQIETEETHSKANRSANLVDCYVYYVIVYVYCYLHYYSINI